MDEIQNLSKQISFNILIYYFKSKSSSPINFINLKGPTRFYENILDGNTTTEKAHETRENCLTVLIEFHLRLSMNRFMEKNLEYK